MDELAREECHIVLKCFNLLPLLRDVGGREGRGEGGERNGLREVGMDGGREGGME